VCDDLQENLDNIRSQIKEARSNAIGLGVSNNSAEVGSNSAEPLEVEFVLR